MAGFVRIWHLRTRFRPDLRTYVPDFACFRAHLAPTYPISRVFACFRACFARIYAPTCPISRVFVRIWHLRTRFRARFRAHLVSSRVFGGFRARFRAFFRPGRSVVSSTMALERIDHAARSADLLPAKYQLPNLRGLTGALTSVSQGPEEILLRLPAETLGIDEAVGVQLAQLAALVGGQVVAGSEDATRALIRTNIRANRSKGTLEDVIAVAVLVPLGTSVVVAEVYPAAIRVTAFSIAIEVARIAFRVLNQTRAAGVRMELIASSAALADTFQVSSDATVTKTSATAGLGAGKLAANFFS